MSTATPVKTHAEAAAPTAFSAISSVEQLVQRLSAEVDAADKRVNALQTEAARVFVGQEQPLKRFVAVADRIHAILLPRLEAITEMAVFKDTKQSVSQELHGRGFHSRTVKLTVPYSDKRPAPMEFSFCVSHDGPLENAVVDYRLAIIPVFIKFNGHDQLTVAIDEPDEEAIAAWIDDQLVGFTRTYYEVYFNTEYQKNSLEMDPVMNVHFPKAFAAATKSHQKRTYFFYTMESSEEFEKDPSEYVTTV